MVEERQDEEVREVRIDKTIVKEAIRYIRVARFPWEKELKNRRKEYQRTSFQLRQFFSNRLLSIIPSRLSFIYQFLSQLRGYLAKLKLDKLEGKIIHLKQKVNYFSHAEQKLKQGKPRLARNILIDLASKYVYVSQTQTPYTPDCMISQSFHKLRKLWTKLEKPS